MKYKIEDIDFRKITPKTFENLCYDLLVNYNFSNVIWRDGGADNGRDIEGTFSFSNPFITQNQKWFFECKHYSAGVPPADLHSKIAWADAEQPNYLVFFISSYITTASRTWLEKISSQKNYTIIVIEGLELKNKILRYSDLIERYFSDNSYEKLFKDIKDYKLKFNIKPSYEVLKEIIENIDLHKLDSEDFGFILLNFYEQHKLFESRNDYYGDFDDKIINKVLQYLKDNTKNDKLSTFAEFRENYDELGGNGFLDEIENIEYDDEYEVIRYNFQYYDLHLNHKLDNKFWKVGNYILIIFENVAFEVFKNEITEIRIISNFEDIKLSEMVSINVSKEQQQEYLSYKQKFFT